MTKVKRTAISLLMVMVMLFVTNGVIYANQTREGEYNSILPPTQPCYIKYTFNVRMPTCDGDGNYKLSMHYFDVDNQYGYPPMMQFTIMTNGTCDFGASVWAKDQFGNYFVLSGTSSQSYNFHIQRSFTAMGTILSAVNDAKHTSTAWVCDDEDYGEFYNQGCSTNN